MGWGVQSIWEQRDENVAKPDRTSCLPCAESRFLLTGWAKHWGSGSAKSCLSQSTELFSTFFCPGQGLALSPAGLCPLQAGPALLVLGTQAQVNVIKRERIESISAVFDILPSGTLVMSLITISKSTVEWKAKGRNK